MGASGRNAALAILGGILDPSHLAELDRTMDRVVRRGMQDHMKLPGFVDPIGPWYAACDAILCASRYEGFSMAMREALAAGLPVVTTSTGIEGIDTVAGEDVVIADDTAATIAAVTRLLGAPHERRRLGVAARRLAERRYDWSVCLEPLGGLYDALVPARVR